MAEDNAVIFTVRNGHSVNCGQPPVIEASPEQYTSYFENEHGEQWIFVRQRHSLTAVVHGGDIGWEEPKTISGPPEKREGFWAVGGIILNMSEALWMAACWAASEPLSK